MNRDLLYAGAAILIVLVGFHNPHLLALVPLSLIFLALIIRNWISFENPKLRLIVILISGLIVEFFSWLAHFLLKTENPALFHSLLGYNLLLGFGFYSGLAIGWTLVSSWFKFTTKEVFFLSIVYGIFVEQTGAVFLTFNPLIWIYATLVYIPMSTPAFILMPIKERPTRTAWKRYTVALVLLAVLAILGTIITGFLFGKLIPPNPPVAGI